MTYTDGLVMLLTQIRQADIADIASVLAVARAVYVLGNGGSQANAAHLCLHLNERGIPAVDLLAETAMMSALSNDHSYQQAPMLRLRRQAKPGDALVVISGSGDSVNLLAALAEAKRIKMVTIGLLGFGGGAAATLCDYACVLDSREYALVEDVHSSILHRISIELQGKTNLT